MKKMFTLLIIIVFCSSCSKSIFYEYFSNEKNQGYYYATVEITPKKEIIYRGLAHSEYNSNRTNKGRVKYIYLYGKNDVNPLNDDYFSFYSKDFYYIKSVLDKDRYGFENKVDYCFFPEQYWFSDDENIDGNLFFYFNKKKDSIHLINRKSDLEKNPCFKNEAINWLPEYLIKVDAIDYTKFRNLDDIKEKYLKDPRKAPKDNF